jgi:hypothetical protein
MSGTAEQLEAVRRRLARGMIPRTGGFHYESIFGCEDRVKSYTPYVCVRVGLRFVEGRHEMNRYVVCVDFHLPLGADIESAEHFKKATNDAVRKAKWAESVVGGLEFHLDVIMAAEVE